MIVTSSPTTHRIWCWVSGSAAAMRNVTTDTDANADRWAAYEPSGPGVRARRQYMTATVPINAA